MKKQWKLAENLIDSKVAVDSLWYISKHLEDLYDVRTLCYNARNKYYINACAVLDKSVCKNKKKKEIISKYDFAKRIYTERDKYYAHKDENYIPPHFYKTLEEEAIYLQNELKEILKLCKDYLPNEISLDYVCYDANLFRQINKINPNNEEKIKKVLFPFYNRVNPIKKDSVSINVLYDTNEINRKDFSKENYGVLFKAGLTAEETLQNLQKACITLNILYDKNTWVKIDLEELNRFMKFRLTRSELSYKKPL